MQKVEEIIHKTIKKDLQNDFIYKNSADRIARQTIAEINYGPKPFPWGKFI